MPTISFIEITLGLHASPPLAASSTRMLLAALSLLALAPAPICRRQLLGAALGGAAFLRPRSASAETRWISGRPDPLRPTNIKEKPDGTKKDNRYLSCLNDCVPRCQGPPGSPAKERSDCLLECQQECCSTYEQCTYTIRG